MVYVADIDLMIPAFLRIRARPDEQEDIRWEFENVTFLLNAIDVLASDTDYVAIRKRKPRYTTLKVVESRVEEARDREFGKRVEFQDKYDKAVKEAEAENESALQSFRSIVTDLQKQKSEGKEINQAELREKVQTTRGTAASPRTPPGDQETTIRARARTGHQADPARRGSRNSTDAVLLQVLGRGHPLDPALPGRTRRLRATATARAGRY